MSDLDIFSKKVWSTAPLAELCDVVIGRTPSRSRPEYWGGEHFWLSIADMNQGRRITTTKEKITSLGVLESGSRLIPAGTVLLSFKLSIGKVAVADIDTHTNEAIAALPILNSKKLNRDFLFWTLRSIRLDEEVDVAAKGKTLNKAKLERIEIPLPPLDEQKRIVAVLDKADGLRRQRKESLELTEKLLQSVFIEMFGDPSEQPQKRLLDLLKRPLRNGLSPASGGAHKGTVFTLSAITRGVFDSSARKEAVFAAPPKLAAQVDKSDFLICRGNGNIKLCGQGQFPTNDAIGIIFPDTIIAAPIDLAQVTKAYFATLWNQPFVRRQIEEGARTAAGIFKVNQTTLENIKIPVPEIARQIEFGQIAEKIVEGKKNLQLSAQYTNELFASLQQCAFRGELELSGLMLDEEELPDAAAVPAHAYREGVYHRPGYFIAPPEIEGQMMVLEERLDFGPGDSIPWSEDYFKYRIISQILVAPFSFSELWERVYADMPEARYEVVKFTVYRYLKEGLLDQQFDKDRKEVVFLPRA